MKDHSEKIKEPAENDIYRYVFEHAGSAMFIADAETGKIVDCNATSEALIGRSRNQIIGMHQSELHPEGEEEKYKKKFALHIEREQITDFEGEVQHSDGRIIPVMISAQVMELGGRKINLGIFVDLTVPRRAEEELRGLNQQIEFIMGATKTGLDIIDSEFNIRYITSAWQTVYGDPAGKKCYEYFMGGKQVCPGCGIPRALATKKPVVTEAILIKENNRPIQVTTIPFQNEKGEWLVAEVNVDITERKRVEEDLEKYRKHLEKMVESRTAEFEAINEKLQRDIAERMRMEEALRKSEEKFRAIFESTRDCIIVWDKDYNYLYANQAAIDHVGTTRDKVIGKNMREGLGHIPDFMQRWMKRVDEVFASGKPVHVEDKVMLGDRLVCSESTLSPIRDSAGTIFAVGVVYRDVTERVRAEEAVREREDFLSSIFTSIQDGISILDKNMNIIRVNPTMERWYAHAMPLVGKKCYEAYHSRTEPCEVCPTKKTLMTNESFCEIVPKAGPGGETVGWLDLYSFPLRDRATGKLRGVIEYVRDISERKKAEEAMRASEAKYRVVADNTYAWEFWMGPDGCLAYSSPSCERITGYTAKEFEMDPGLLLAIIHHDDRSRFASHEQDPDRGALPSELEFRIIHRDGSVRWISHVCQQIYDADGKYLGTRGSNRDITGHKLAEEALKESEERYRSLFEQAPDSVILIDLETGDFVAFNDRAHKNLGYTRMEFQRLRIQDFEVIESPEEVSAHIQKIVKEGGDVFETKQRTKRGEIRDILVSARPISAHGKTFIQTIFRDITEQKRAEKKLSESEEKYRALMDGAGDMILLADTEGHILEANKRALELLGYSKNTLTTMHFAQLHPEQERARVVADFKSVVESGRSFITDIPVFRYDGKLIPMDITTCVIEYAGKKLVQGIFRDISERKRIEQMKDNLIRDVSHELKAPIAVVEMALDMGQRAIETGDVNAIRKAWRMGSRNIKTLSRDVNNILEMFSLSARRAVPQRKQISLKKMATEIVRDFQDPIAQKILRVTIDIPGKIDKIYADVRMMRTLIYNIIDNAVKFTRRGAIALTVRSRRNEIWLKVKDTGCGIASKDTSIIFTRFFKQDPSIHGTGLGLAICKEIAEIYCGTIQVTSAGAGKGTVVTVKLPRAALGI